MAATADGKRPGDASRATGAATTHHYRKTTAREQAAQGARTATGTGLQLPAFGRIPSPGQPTSASAAPPGERGGNHAKVPGSLPSSATSGPCPGAVQSWAKSTRQSNRSVAGGTAGQRYC